MITLDLCFRAAELARLGKPFVAVTLLEATGSTPADAGAKILVTEDGLDAGTVGGGRIEAKAITIAKQMLIDKSDCQLVDWSLRTDVGMTCGGRVKLFFEPTCVSTWPIVVFGAGHIAQALAQLLAKLPCQAKFIDPRSEWLDRLPEGVDRIQVDDPSKEVDNLPSDAFVLCMTKGHKHDLPVLVKLLQSPNKWPYVGVIGSKSKKAVLTKELLEAGITEKRLDFHCPIGLPIGSNHPMEIAVSISAQLLACRDGNQF